MGLGIGDWEIRFAVAEILAHLEHLAETGQVAQAEGSAGVWLFHADYSQTG